MRVKLDNEKIRYIALFEKITNVTPKDCVECQDGERLTFVVRGKDMGKAIGKNGRNIKRARDEFGRNVDLVEYSNDPLQFIKNIFPSADVKDVEIIDQNNERIASLDINLSEKGKVVGRGGWSIKRARKLAARHHGISDISLN